MKRVFGTVEALFDIFYLVAAALLGFILIAPASGSVERTLAGIMALVLAGGDAFHLIPRIMLIRTGKEEELQTKLGRGKQVTSITMTLFYLFLWHIGVLIYSPAGMQGWTYSIYFLAFIRIVLCLMPQNRWEEKYPPKSWGIWRNIPFFLQGIVVASLYCAYRSVVPGLGFMWVATLLSFALYLPVVLWVDKNPKIGMLMIPKMGTYLWMLFMSISL